MKDNKSCFDFIYHRIDTIREFGQQNWLLKASINKTSEFLYA